MVCWQNVLVAEASSAPSCSRDGPSNEGHGARSLYPAPAGRWVWAATADSVCLGGGSSLWLRRSQCSMSLVTAVLAEGTTIPTCVTFSRDDLYPF